MLELAITKTSWMVISNFSCPYHSLLNKYSIPVDVEKCEQMWAINMRGPLLCYKYAAKQMVKQGDGGRIIGTSLRVDNLADHS
jgi:NAD(P)-dependent dehydrogenase (short-subunit alcohol dehydrogenase family)